MRYAVVIERGERNYSAYVPDLPGCVSVGDTLEEVKTEIREAIEFHLDGMREDGQPIPKPSTRAEYVEVREQGASCACAWRSPVAV
jgi:predicted RNase H-like HicB family nuclease